MPEPKLIAAPNYANAVYQRVDGQMVTLVVGQDKNIYEVPLRKPGSTNPTPVSYVNLNRAAGCRDEWIVALSSNGDGFSYPGSVSPYITSEGRNTIVYTSPSGLIELSSTSSSNWSCSLIQDQSFPALRFVTSPPFARNLTDQSNVIVFVADNQHVWEARREKNAAAWYFTDLNAVASGDNFSTVGSATAFVRSSGEFVVLAVGTDKHVYGIQNQNGSWISTDLTNAAKCVDIYPKAPDAQDFAAPIAVDGVDYIHYRCNNGRICEIFNGDGNWCWGDLTSSSETTETAAVAPLVPGCVVKNWNFGSGDGYTLFYTSSDTVTRPTYVSAVYLLNGAWHAMDRCLSVGLFSTVDGEVNGCFPSGARSSFGEVINHVSCNGNQSGSGLTLTYDLWATTASWGLTTLTYEN